MTMNANRYVHHPCFLLLIASPDGLAISHYCTLLNFSWNIALFLLLLASPSAANAWHRKEQEQQRVANHPRGGGYTSPWTSHRSPSRISSSNRRKEIVQQNSQRPAAVASTASSVPTQQLHQSKGRLLPLPTKQHPLKSKQPLGPQRQSSTASLATTTTRKSVTHNNINKTQKASSKVFGTELSKLDASLFATYFCNSVAITLPVILMPLIAAEHVALAGPTTVSAAAFVATVASISSMGGGLGKLCNGIVCQSIGGRLSSAIYLSGIAVCSTLLSTANPALAGWILAGTEFCASIQWMACSFILSNHYQSSPANFAKGVTILSLASTSGTLLAKMGGTALLRYLSWRSVAQVGAATALLGAMIVQSCVSDHPSTGVRTRDKNHKPAAHPNNVFQSFRTVLGSPLFWSVGIAHATAFVARTSDRVLGAFFQDVTSLPRKYRTVS